MTPQKAFCIFFGIHLHFTSEDYSVIKYGMNTKQSMGKFDALPQGNKFRFEWLSQQYPNPQDLVYACIGCQFDEVDMRFSSKEDIIDSFFKFKSRREGMTYALKGQISKYSDSPLPIEKLIFKYLIAEYSPEFMLLMGYNNDNLSNLYQNKNLAWCKGKILKIIKYTDFFNCPKFLPLLTEIK